MNEKIEAILLQIAKKLKEDGWIIGKDVNVDIKVEGYISLVHEFVVEGSLGEAKWKDQLAVTIHFKLGTEDEVTYWPEFTIYAQISVAGVENIKEENIEYPMQSNVSFTTNDARNEEKAAEAAREITRLVESHVQDSYYKYIERNEKVVRYYKEGGSGT